MRLWILLIGCVLATQSVSQTVPGSQSAPSSGTAAPGVAITGVVLDPTDAGVSKAGITLRQNGVVFATTTADATGAFRLDGVQPGSYEIGVEHEGLKSATSRVRVGARPPSALVIRLIMAEVRSAVTVSAQASQVSTNAADNLDTVALTRQSLDDLPIFD
jgi:Carboxypeptidase regulatory-like domain